MSTWALRRTEQARDEHGRWTRSGAAEASARAEGVKVTSGDHRSHVRAALAHERAADAHLSVADQYDEKAKGSKTKEARELREGKAGEHRDTAGEHLDQAKDLRKDLSSTDRVHTVGPRPDATPESARRASEVANARTQVAEARPSREAHREAERAHLEAEAQNAEVHDRALKASYMMPIDFGRDYQRAIATADEASLAAKDRPSIEAHARAGAANRGAAAAYMALVGKVDHTSEEMAWTHERARDSLVVQEHGAYGRAKILHGDMASIHGATAAAENKKGSFRAKALSMAATLKSGLAMHGTAGRGGEGEHLAAADALEAVGLHRAAGVHVRAAIDHRDARDAGRTKPPKEDHERDAQLHERASRLYEAGGDHKGAVSHARDAAAAHKRAGAPAEVQGSAKANLARLRASKPSKVTGPSAWVSRRLGD